MRLNSGGAAARRWLPGMALAFPGPSFAATGGDSFPLSLWGWLVFIGALVAGLAWFAVRRSRSGSGEQAATTQENRLSSLLEHADCLLWEAEVFMAGAKQDTWEWKFTLQPSGLARRIFEGLVPPWDIGTWNGLGAPDKPEMNARCYEAVQAGRPGYEQSFRLIRPERVLWLHESVAITRTDEKHFRLVGLTTDVTAQWLAEQANRASEEKLQQLLSQANCMLWQANVTCDEKGEFKWEWFVPKSELYRRMTDDSAQKAIMPWGLMDVPEFQEIEARSRHAMRHGLPGYEQVFRVIKDGQTQWMHEQVSITHLTPRSWKLEGVVIDITAQRQAEEAQRASDAQLGKLLEVADCMVWEAKVTLLPGDTLQWSHYMPRSALYQRIFGETAKVELNWHTLNVPELGEMTASALQAVKSHATGYMQEFRVVQPTGTIWLREVVTIAPLTSSQFRMVGVITDITGRREAEEARQSTEGRLDNLLMRADCLLWEGTADLTAENWEWSFTIQDSGLSRKLYGQPHPDSSAGLWRRFKIPEWAEMNHRCRTAMTEGRPGYEQIFHIVREDGSAVWIQERVTIKQIGPTLYSLVGVAMDITRQHGAELALAAEKERLAVTLRTMIEAVITTDANGQILFINSAAATLTGWNIEAAVGLPLTDICRFENNRTGVWTEIPLMRVAQADVVVNLPPHTRLIPRDQLHRLVEGCCAPIHAPDNCVTGMVLVFRDVTEQEQLEQELIRATRLESVGVLAGGIAHDFNNILTAVLGNLTLAQLEIGPDVEAGERLREAEKATMRARDLTQQLLTFSKGGEPVLAAVHLGTVLRETADFALHGSRVKPVYDIAPDLWAADADKGQIGRVIQNLVINAVQAMPAGGMLRLGARNETISAPGHPPGLVPGEYVHLVIADSGDGIASDNLTRIFDPYFTTKKSGSGLGLAAVYSIVKKHHGRVDVESQVGKGTTFRLWLPAMRRPSVEDKASPTVTRPNFSGRVLFMDDEESIRKMAGLMLRQVGFFVESAAEGQEAVQKFQAACREGNPFNLVIMDLTVPGGLGGREAIEQLRAIDPRVKAIVSSGYSSDPVLANHRAHGFCGVLVKPYQLADVLRAIREALAE